MQKPRPVFETIYVFAQLLLADDRKSKPIVQCIFIAYLSIYIDEIWGTIILAVLDSSCQNYYINYSNELPMMSFILFYVWRMGPGVHKAAWLISSRFSSYSNKKPKYNNVFISHRYGAVDSKSFRYYIQTDRKTRTTWWWRCAQRAAVP